MAILTERKVWRRDAGSPVRIRLKLTVAERENVRNALVYFCARLPKASDALVALGVTKDMIAKARSRNRHPTYGMAYAIARAVGVPVEKVMDGRWPGDRCPHCGGTGKRSQITRTALRSAPAQ